MSTIDDGYARPGIGLISVGWMGKLHTRAYQAIPQVYPELKIRPRLVHAADTAADRADYAREILGYTRASTDYRDVLADPDVDVVSICAPNMLHREIGVAAARAGKAFWIEKPVGRDAGETAEVAAAAQAAGVTTSIGYNYRHVPAVERVRDLIPAGLLGRLPHLPARVSVGPQCSLGFEIYGTEGSAIWNFEQMNELRLCLGRGGPAHADHGYTTILGHASLGDYGRFQPGPGHSMSYDDLKVIEARKFLVAVGGGEQRNSTIAEALADAEVIAATAASARDGAWHKVAPVPGATVWHASCPPMSTLADC